MSTLWQDIRYALRMLVRNSRFSMIVVMLMAIGIGVNTTVFTLLNAYLFRSSPYEEGERIVLVAGRTQRGPSWSVSYPDFLDWCRQAKSFDTPSYCRLRYQTVSVTTSDPPERCSAGFVSGSFLRIFPTEAFMGRLLSGADDDPSADPVVVISHAFWQRRFGSDPNAIGRSITLGDRSHTIIGVTLPRFQFPPYGGWARTDLWLPADPIASGDSRGGGGSLYAVGRLKAGVNVAQAQAEMETICAHLAAEYPASNAGRSATVAHFRDYMATGQEQVPVVVMGTVLMVFLITCANVSGLLFARGVVREREMALRSALGAARLRLVRLILLENTIPALLGGGLGVLGASWAVVLLARTDTFQATQIPAGFFRLDGRVIGFALALSVLAVPLSGLLPAIGCSGARLARTLAAGSRNVLGCRSRNATHTGLLSTQVALTILLLVAAGLMMRSLVNAVTMDLGFNSKNVLAMDVELDKQNYGGRDEQLSFYRQLLDRLRAIPGVERAALDRRLGMRAPFHAEGNPVSEPGQVPTADYKVVSEGNFKTRQIPLWRGRYFDERDDISSAPVAVVDQRLAQRHWPNTDPIGKHIQLGETPDPNAPGIEIVGVVGNVRRDASGEDPRVQVYRPFLQQPQRRSSILIRTRSDPKAYVAAMKDAVYQIDRGSLLCDARTKEEVLWYWAFNHRVIGSLLSVFAGIALFLSAAGIYAITRYSVSRRTQELGIRIALGANRNDLLRLVLRKAFMPVLIGIAIGLAATIAVARMLSSLLFQLSPWDPATYAAVSLLLIGVTLLASYLPARRAMKVDPMEASRYE